MCNIHSNISSQEKATDLFTEKTYQKELRFNLQIVEGIEGISEFSEDWDDLFARAVDAPPYLSRPWTCTFIQECKIKGNPLFILAWCEHKLVALFPLAVHKCLTVKIAKPIGTGDGAYLGLLLDPNYSSAVDHIVESIKSKKLFDVYYSDDLSSEDSATNALLDRLVTEGYSCRKIRRNPCYWIQLGCSYDEYLKRKIPKSKRRYKLKYKEKRLNKSADVKVTRHAGKEVTPEINRRAAIIQSESWLKRRGGTVLERPFYQKLLANMAKANLACVWLMTIDGEDAAMVYSFIAHKQLHFYWTSFKLKFESPLSIGQMLIIQVVRDACEDGIMSFDFIHGDAEYKRFWATDCYDVQKVVAGLGLFGNIIAARYYAFWRIVRIKFVRSLYHRFKSIKVLYMKKTSK